MDKGRITARELYEFLELNWSHYSRWCRMNITNNVYAQENVDWWGSPCMVNGNETMDYHLTVSFAKKLCMLSPTERGNQARDYFIEIENQLKELIEKPMALPKTFSEACRMLADEFEQRMIAEEKVSIMAPKAEAFDVFIGSSGYYNMNTTAKLLNRGRNKLFKQLRDIGVLMEDNVPYQKHIDSGKFAVKAGANNGFAYNITLVSPEGVEFIRNVI